MLGVFLDRDTMAVEDLDFGPLDTAVDEWRNYGASDPAQIDERIQGAAVVVVNKVVLNAANLEVSTDLKLVCIAATGTNNVDLDAAKRQGIRVTNVRGYGTASVSQHVVALLLALATRLPDYHQAVRSGRWQGERQFCFLDFPIHQIRGATLGIVGYGELGRGVAELAEGLGMRILIAQRPGGEPQAGRVPLAELLPRVDALTLHCPLTPDTQNLIGHKELTLMKPTALLINAARGGIVDEQALADALRNGVIAGAGVDVLSQEPPVNGNPLLEGGIPNLIVTPHVAWGSQPARQTIVDELAANIRAYFAGETRNVVA